MSEMRAERLWPVKTDAEPETTAPAAPVRLMPTEADVPEIHKIAEMYSGDMYIYEVCATSGGVLVSYSRDEGSPAPALEAVGYTTVGLRKGLVLVAGAVDQVARLEAQIAALKAERERVLQATTGAPF